jgi:hypothetical protein
MSERELGDELKRNAREEQSKLSRRSFLGRGSAAMAMAASLPVLHQRSKFAI